MIGDRKTPTPARTAGRIRLRAGAIAGGRWSLRAGSSAEQRRPSEQDAVVNDLFVMPESSPRSESARIPQREHEPCHDQTVRRRGVEAVWLREGLRFGLSTAVDNPVHRFCRGH